MTKISNCMVINEISEILNNCPICQGTDLKNRSTASDASGVYLQKVYCPGCDFIFSKVRPKANWMSKNVYVTTAFNPNSAIETRRYKRYKNISEIFQKVIPECATLLDVGAGSGTGTKAFYDAGFEVVGIEPDIRSDSIKDSFNTRFSILSTSIEDYIKVNHRQFDIVTFVQCLEHIYDPKAVLKSIAQTVREDGYLYIEVPDKKDIGFFDWAHLPHVSYFSFNSLLRLLAGVGFTPHCRVYSKTRPYGPSQLGMIFKKNPASLAHQAKPEAEHKRSRNEALPFSLQGNKPIVFETAIIQSKLDTLNRATLTNRSDSIVFQYSLKSERSRSKTLKALLFFLIVSPLTLIRYSLLRLRHKIKSCLFNDPSFERFEYKIWR